MSFAALLAPDFLLIVAGYLICRYTVLNRPLWDQVERIVYFVLFPALLFYSISRAPLDFLSASRFIAAALLLCVMGVALAYCTKFLPGAKFEDMAGSAQIGFRFNSYIALALSERLAGSEGLLMVAILIGFCVPFLNMAAVWPMVRYRLKSDAGKQDERSTDFFHALLRNPLIIASLAGLAANTLGLRVPQVIEPAVARLGQASLALGLMAAGAGLQLSGVFNTASRRRVGAALLLNRHLLMPLLGLALIQGFGLAGAQATVLLVFAALPTAASCYVLATRMGFEGGYVAGLVTCSTLLGMLSLSFALQLKAAFLS